MDVHDAARGPGNLAGLLAAAARVYPDGEAVVDEQRRVSWAGLHRESIAVATGLGSLGVVAGHRVAVLLPNRVELVASYLGALGAGLVAVPLNPRSVTGEIVRALADSGARVVVCDSATAPGARAAVAGLADALDGADASLRARAVVPQVVVVDAPTLPGEHRYDDLVATPGEAVPPPQDPETLAALLYTAGTGGRPRAAMLTHRALLANIAQTASLDPPPVHPDDRVLGVLPLFHVYGLNAVLGQVLHQHACLVTAQRFDEEGTLALVERESVTNLPLAPPALAAWAGRADLHERLGGVRTVVSGASPVAHEVVRAFEQSAGLPVHQGYGLTECAPVVTTTLAAPEHRKPGSVGRPLPGVEVGVVDASGQTGAGSDPGEIRVRGASLFSGYWPDGDGGPGPDGWYRTGDIGYLDEDGDLFLVDRLKEVVIVSGFNVYPVEIEEAISEVDGVAEVAVIGVEDQVGDEAVVAYVVPRPATGDPEPLVRAVRSHCESRLAPFKRPHAVHVVDRLPHSVSGKVAKGRLRDEQRRRSMGLA